MDTGLPAGKEGEAEGEEDELDNNRDFFLIWRRNFNGCFTQVDGNLAEETMFLFRSIGCDTLKGGCQSQRSQKKYTKALLSTSNLNHVGEYETL